MEVSPEKDHLLPYVHFNISRLLQPAAVSVGTEELAEDLPQVSE